MAWMNLNLGSIIVLEILLWSRQQKTSLSFPVLITILCQRVGVPFVEATDVRVSPAAFSDIL